MPDQENLMKTIRMPRRMGEITERLPAPQYDQQQQMVKRTRSQPQSQLEVIDDSASAKLQTASKQRLEAVTRNDTS